MTLSFEKTFFTFDISDEDPLSAWPVLLFFVSGMISKLGLILQFNRCNWNLKRKHPFFPLSLLINSDCLKRQLETCAKVDTATTIAWAGRDPRFSRSRQAIYRRYWSHSQTTDPSNLKQPRTNHVRCAGGMVACERLLCLTRLANEIVTRCAPSLGVCVSLHPVLVVANDKIEI